MKSIPSSYVTEKTKLASTSPWIWLIEIDIGTSQRVYFTPYLKNVVWPSTGGNTYYGYPCEPPRVTETSEDEADNVALTIANPDQQFTPFLDQNRGLTGQLATIRLAHEDHLSETTIPAWIFRVSRTRLARETIQMELGPLAQMEEEVPRSRFDRVMRRWATFGGRACGYDTTRPTAKFTTCPRTRQACLDRGQDEDDGGVGRKHPERFGGFLGLPVIRQ